MWGEKQNTWMFEWNMNDYMIAQSLGTELLNRNLSMLLALWWGVFVGFTFPIEEPQNSRFYEKFSGLQAS